MLLAICVILELMYETLYCKNHKQILHYPDTFTKYSVKGQLGTSTLTIQM